MSSSYTVQQTYNQFLELLRIHTPLHGLTRIFLSEKSLPVFLRWIRKSSRNWMQLIFQGVDLQVSTKRCGED